jgi:hypothetical protein
MSIAYHESVGIVVHIHATVTRVDVDVILDRLKEQRHRYVQPSSLVQSMLNQVNRLQKSAYSAPDGRDTPKLRIEDYGPPCISKSISIIALSLMPPSSNSSSSIAMSS